MGGNKNWKPFKISYKATVPKKEECTNIITPTCLSSSYIGYGSIRIVPTFMILGQSTGAASVIAIENNLAVQDISYDTLERMLLEENQILEIPQNWLEIISSNN